MRKTKQTRGKKNESWAFWNFHSGKFVFIVLLLENVQWHFYRRTLGGGEYTIMGTEREGSRSLARSFALRALGKETTATQASVMVYPVSGI